MSQKIRIKLKSFDHALVDKSADKIVKTVKATGAVVSGPIPLPTDKKIFTVNRSTFVNKKAREQFELNSFRRLLDIYSSTPKTVDALMKLELPIKESYMIAKFMRETNGDMDFYSETLKKIISETKDSNSTDKELKILPNKVEDFNKKTYELDNQEVEINPLELNFSNMPQDSKFTPEDIYWIFPILKV